MINNAVNGLGGTLNFVAANKDDSNGNFEKIKQNNRGRVFRFVLQDKHYCGEVFQGLCVGNAAPGSVAGALARCAVDSSTKPANSRHRTKVVRFKWPPCADRSVRPWRRPCMRKRQHYWRNRSPGTAPTEASFLRTTCHGFR